MVQAGREGGAEVTTSVLWRRHARPGAPAPHPWPARLQLFTRRAAATLYGNQRLQRWCFDVELILLAHRLGVPIAEVQVHWTEMPGSKIRFTSILHMAFELATLKASRSWRAQRSTAVHWGGAVLPWPGRCVDAWGIASAGRLHVGWCSMRLQHGTAEVTSSSPASCLLHSA